MAVSKVVNQVALAFTWLNACICIAFILLVWNVWQTPLIIIPAIVTAYDLKVCYYLWRRAF